MSYQALREIPVLESCFKETLRLHPPLILLMRKVVGSRSPTRTGASPVGTERRRLDRGLEPRSRALRRSRSASTRRRFGPDRAEDQHLFGWIPFGAGRHRCVGAPFAMMQVKAIFSILLRRYDFELAQPPETYESDHSKMVVQLAQPCRVRYRRRH